MNARKFFNVRVSLTVTALALGGALVFSAMTTSCAGGGGCGGSAGGAGGGGGGAAGGSTGASCSAGSNGVCFSGGQASGLMSGYGWIALGAHDTATSPVCDNTANGGTASQTITSSAPCPETGGKTVWTDPDKGLCISGTVPKVGNDSSGAPDYTGYWGVQLGANTDTSGGTVDLSKYTKITLAFNSSGVTPTNTAIRAEIHVQGHTPADENYCATVQEGKASSLTAFNTKCWDGSGDNLVGDSKNPDNLKKIDKVGLQISSDTSKDYTVTNFCWSGITFE